MWLERARTGKNVDELQKAIRIEFPHVREAIGLLRHQSAGKQRPSRIALDYAPRIVIDAQEIETRAYARHIFKLDYILKIFALSIR